LLKQLFTKQLIQLNSHFHSKVTKNNKHHFVTICFEAEGSYRERFVESLDAFVSLNKLGITYEHIGLWYLCESASAVFFQWQYGTSANHTRHRTDAFTWTFQNLIFVEQSSRHVFNLRWRHEVDTRYKCFTTAKVNTLTWVRWTLSMCYWINIAI